MRLVVGVIQLANQVVLLMRNLPDHSVPSVIFIFPAISSLAPGLSVQIPTAPVDDTLILLLPSPSAMMMLLERSDASHVTLAPRIVFPEPDIIPHAVLAPRAVLLSHEILSRREATPLAVLLEPLILAERVNTQLAVLDAPVLFA